MVLVPSIQQLESAISMHIFHPPEPPSYHPQSHPSKSYWIIAVASCSGFSELQPFPFSVYPSHSLLTDLVETYSDPSVVSISPGRVLTVSCRVSPALLHCITLSSTPTMPPITLFRPHWSSTVSGKPLPRKRYILSPLLVASICLICSLSSFKVSFKYFLHSHFNPPHSLSYFVLFFMACIIDCTLPFPSLLCDRMSFPLKC